jgi:hypothetical protein
MALPTKSTTLSPEEVEDINKKLGDMRHAVNNYLSLITAGIEVLARKPEMIQRIMGPVIEQPQKISDEIRKFSDMLEEKLGIK